MAMTQPVHAVEANSFVSYGGDQRQPEYYALPFCKPEGGVQKREQGGWSAQRDLLSLKRVYNTPYVFHINVRPHPPMPELLRCNR